MMINPPCPKPNKKAYDRLSAALKAADKVTRFDARPYQCECGRWHLTSIKMAEKERRR
jgi:hypothetical protein